MVAMEEIKPSISVILATYNRAEDLMRVLHAYETQITPEPFEVLIVDDASADHTWELLRTYQSDITRHRDKSNLPFTLQIQRMRQNSGPGQARNQAIPLVKAPLVLFTGDDIIPERNFIEAHLAAHRRFPKQTTAILGHISRPEDMVVNTLMEHIDGLGAQQFSYHFFQNEKEYDYRHFYTSNISLKRTLLLSLDHWFNSDFPFAGFEDVELGYRLHKNGMQIIYSNAPSASHYHYHTIYSFSRRQYRTGLMACILVNKHPELRRLIYGKGLSLRLIKARLRHLFQPVSPVTVEDLEETILRLLSFYENTPHALLESLYRIGLQYFFYRGIVDGNLQNDPQCRNISAAFAKPRLESILRWYIPLSRKMNIPLPSEGLFPYSDDLEKAGRTSKTV
jgi:GT2 family glycosyltransferase